LRYVAGPESVGMDVLLHGVAHVYGLPERSTALNLPSTRYAYLPHDTHTHTHIHTYTYTHTHTHTHTVGGALG
jgi:carbohydrate-binding DOMON domain-containing protein